MGDVAPAAAKRGFALFNNRTGCASCHSGWAFSDGSFHDIGTATGDDRPFPTAVKLRHAFRTPTLRDVARRGPDMPDGSLPTLRVAIDLHDRGGTPAPMPAVRHLTAGRRECAPPLVRRVPSKMRQHV